MRLGKGKRLATLAGCAALAVAALAATPREAKAWVSVGIGLPGVYVAPPPPVYYPPRPVYVAPPPVYYPPPPAYYGPPRRVWVPPHWRGGYWVPGHWG